MKKYFKEIKDKSFLLSIFILLGGQSIIYALIKFLQSNYHTFNFAIDDIFPLIPPFIIIYNLFYPFLFFVFYFLFTKDKKTYDKAIISGILGYIICNIIFLIYPVQMIRPDISNLNTDWLSNFILQLTYKFDNPSINCFPSIHCLFCFQIIYSIWRCKNINYKYKISITIIALTIVSSIFFVRQHYVIDLIAALILSIICNVFIELIYNKIKKNK